MVRPASTGLPPGARPPVRPPPTGQAGQLGAPRPSINGQGPRPGPAVRPAGTAQSPATPAARPANPGARPPPAVRPLTAPRPALGARPPAVRPPPGNVRPGPTNVGARPPTARPAPAIPPKPAAIGSVRPPVTSATASPGALGKLPTAPANPGGSLGSLNIPANKQFPIVVKPIPAHLRNSNLNTHSHILDGPPLVVDEGTIILNPSIFSHLTPDQLKHLQSLGAQQTLQILQAYIVQHLREKLRQQGANGAKASAVGTAAKTGSTPAKPATPATNAASAGTTSAPAPKPPMTAPTVPKPATKATSTPVKAPAKPAPGKTPLPANVANNPAIAALLSSAQQLAAKSGSTPASRSGSPAAQPPAETVRVIAQLAATAGNPSSASTPLTPNAVALLQYLRQVGAGANMTTAAHILATGVIPPGVIQEYGLGQHDSSAGTCETGRAAAAIGCTRYYQHTCNCTETWSSGGNIARTGGCFAIKQSCDPSCTARCVEWSLAAFSTYQISCSDCFTNRVTNERDGSYHDNDWRNNPSSAGSFGIGQTTFGGRSFFTRQ
jgi:hypothetical protein